MEDQENIISGSSIKVAEPLQTVNLSELPVKFLGLERVRKTHAVLLPPDDPRNPSLGEYTLIFNDSYDQEDLIEKKINGFKTISELLLPEFSFLNQPIIEHLQASLERIRDNPEVQKKFRAIIYRHESEHRLQEIRFQLMKKLKHLREIFAGSYKASSPFESYRHHMVDFMDIYTFSEVEAYMAEITIPNADTDIQVVDRYANNIIFITQSLLYHQKGEKPAVEKIFDTIQCNKPESIEYFNPSNTAGIVLLLQNPLIFQKIRSGEVSKENFIEMIKSGLEELLKDPAAHMKVNLTSRLSEHTDNILIAAIARE